MSRRRQIALIAAACLFAARTAMAVKPQYFHGNDTITNATLPFSNADGIVGFTDQDDAGNNIGPTNAVLTLDTNGTWQNDLFVYTASTLNIQGGDATHPGGAVRGNTSVYDTSTINISGKGVTTFLTLYDQSTFNMTGGAVGLASNINSALLTWNFSKTTITGGIVQGFLTARDSSTVTMNGGEIVSNVDVENNSSIAVNGGALIDSDIIAEDQGTAQIAGGTVRGSVACNGGTATFSAGTIGRDLAAAGGTATMTGGTAGGISANLNGTASMSAGSLTGDAVAGTSFSVGGTLNLSGASAIGGNVAAANGSTITISDSVNIVGDGSESNSTIHFNGGTIGGNFTASGTSGSLIIDGGSLKGSYSGQGQSRLSFLSGSIGKDISLANTATATIDNGDITGQITTTDSSTLQMNGGTAEKDVTIQSSSSATVTGGATLRGSFGVTDGAFAHISGSATIIGPVTTDGSCTLVMDGGLAVQGITANGASFVAYSGGRAAFLAAFGAARILWAGGTLMNNVVAGAAPVNGAHLASSESVPPPIYLHDNSSLEIDGVRLSATLLDASNSGGAFSQYQLSGYFPDGTPLPGGTQIFVQNPASGSFGASLEIAPTDQDWNVDGGGSWATDANYLPAIAPEGAGAVVYFGSIITAPATVHLDGDHTVGSLTFDSTQAYTVDAGTGGTLFFANVNGASSELTVQQNGHHQLLAPVVFQDDAEVNVGNNGSRESRTSLAMSTITIAPGHSLTKWGGGKLSADSVRGGALNLYNGALRMNPNGTSAATSKVEALQFANGATLDLADNDMIVQNETPDDYQPFLQTGYAGGAWTGKGIASAAAALPANSGKGIGMISGASYLALHPGMMFDGYTVDPTDVLMKYTWLGDADLSGLIDGNDYFQIDQGYAGQLTGYLNGDFNYDGRIDADDYFLIDSNYARQTTMLGGISPVPEPASVVFAGLAILPIARRAKKTSRPAGNNL